MTPPSLIPDVCVPRLISGPSTAVGAEDLLLSDEEVQEAALRALWLGHYWVRLQTGREGIQQV